jgi:3D (Asp-Asp-Asp) domain-containing protein
LQKSKRRFRMHNCSWRVIVCTLLLGAMALASAARDQGSDRVETRVERTEIPFSATYEFSRTVAGGRVVKARDGVPGTVTRTYRITFRGGQVVNKELVGEERVEPVAALMLMGRLGYQPSRQRFSRNRVLTMDATAYDPSPRTIGPGATGRTKTGMRATYGVVAVDPKVIPLGTLLFVEGYGFAIAADIGGAIKGNKIDLCFDDRATALRFGRQKVRVHILRAA